MARRQQHYSGIGGQAVLEGVMMKNGDRYAVAVRKPDGEIEVEVDEYHGLLEGSVLTKIPFVRGVFAFLDSMILGFRSLNYSTSFYEEESEAMDMKPDDPSAERREKIVYGITLAVALVIAITLFMIVPFLLTQLLRNYVRSASLLAILEGLIRIAIFLAYIIGITAMKDIRRLYQYHGAEHKCINCIERGRPLTLENARRSTRFHKRCGTSFILLVLLVSIVLFFFIRVDNMLLRLLIRIAMIPLISGISYELIRLAGRSSGLLISIISAPGLWMQRITTKEPDDGMLETAMASVEAVFDWKKYLQDEFGYDEESLAAVGVPDSDAAGENGDGGAEGPVLPF